MNMLYLNMYMNYMLMIIFILISISFFTLLERKMFGFMQLRKGPNKVGIIGIIQAISDGMKLFTNEYMKLIQVNWIYYYSPMMMFLLSFFMWILFPYMYNLMKLNNYMLFLFCLMSMNIYPMMFAGLYSNSLYSMLGGLRSISQTISYEVSFILLIFIFLILVENLNLKEFMKLDMIFFFYFYMFVMLIYISMLAELNRTPFDFSESESELISGYNIEYMSGMFALIFLSEYSNIIFLMLIFIMMFFSGLNLMMIFILWMIMLLLIIIIRGVLPRLRYDKLMILIWLNYLPIILNYLILVLSLKYLIF